MLPDSCRVTPSPRLAPRGGPRRRVGGVTSTHAAVASESALPRIGNDALAARLLSSRTRASSPCSFAARIRSSRVSISASLLAFFASFAAAFATRASSFFCALRLFAASFFDSPARSSSGGVGGRDVDFVASSSSSADDRDGVGGGSGASYAAVAASTSAAAAAVADAEEYSDAARAAFAFRGGGGGGFFFGDGVCRSMSSRTIASSPSSDRGRSPARLPFFGDFPHSDPHDIARGKIFPALGDVRPSGDDGGRGDVPGVPGTSSRASNPPAFSSSRSTSNERDRARLDPPMHGRHCIVGATRREGFVARRVFRHSE